MPPTSGIVSARSANYARNKYPAPLHRDRRITIKKLMYTLNKIHVLRPLPDNHSGLIGVNHGRISRSTERRERSRAFFSHIAASGDLRVSFCKDFAARMYFSVPGNDTEYRKVLVALCIFRVTIREHMRKQIRARFARLSKPISEHSEVACGRELPAFPECNRAGSDFREISSHRAFLSSSHANLFRMLSEDIGSTDRDSPVRESETSAKDKRRRVKIFTIPLRDVLVKPRLNHEVWSRERKKHSLRRVATIRRPIPELIVR